MRRLIAISAVLISLSACTSVKHMPLTVDASTRLQDSSVVTTQYEKPDFSAFTAGKAAFGVFGAAAMISEGNSIINENNIEDPAIAIAQGLADKLTTVRSANVLTSGQISKNDNINELLKVNAGADYLLDVKTLGWMFNYYPTDWAHYRVNYSARLRLIDAASKKVIAESMCQSVQGDDQNPPSKEQLLNNKAALLKDYLAKAADSCVAVLAKDVLRI